MPQTTDQLKAAIMNLPCKPPRGTSERREHEDEPEAVLRAYIGGHRDARHAAAELVSAVPLVAEAPREQPLPEGWATEALEAIWNAPIGTTITADMKRAASLALRVARGERWDDDSYGWVAPSVSVAPMPEEWLKETERLLTEYANYIYDTGCADATFDKLGAKHASTEAGETRAALLSHLRTAPRPTLSDEQIDQLSTTIRDSRKVVDSASVAPQPEQPKTEQPHLADNGEQAVQGLDAEGVKERDEAERLRILYAAMDYATESAQHPNEPPGAAFDKLRDLLGLPPPSGVPVAPALVEGGGTYEQVAAYERGEHDSMIREYDRTHGVDTSDEWSEAERIRDLPAVDDAIRNFLIDSTGGNSTCMVREVMRALGVALPETPKEN